MISGLDSKRINDTFWRLSCHVRVPVMRREVMAILWLMRCPKGLDRVRK